MTSPIKYCDDLFAHSLDKMVTVGTDKNVLTKQCPICGYSESLKRSHSQTLFVNNTVLQVKKWGHDENVKELLQPMNKDGSTNEDFTNAYGFNPFDSRTKIATPKIQGGLA